MKAAAFRAQVAVRDSKAPDGDTLIVSVNVFAAFIDGIVRG